MPDGFGFAGGSDNSKPRENLGKKKKAKSSKQRKVERAIKRGASPTEALRKAGYAPSVVNNPQIVTRSEALRDDIESWRREVRKAFPAQRLVPVLEDGLQATRVVTASYEGKITDEVAYADQAERRKTVELISKLCGRLTDDSKTQVAASAQVTVVFMGRNGSNSQLAAEAAALVVPVERN